MLRGTLVLMLTAAALTAAASDENVRLSPSAPSSPPMNGTLLAFLNSIADWTMTLDVGTNILNNSTVSTVNSSIFINGNLARVLLAAHKLQPNTRYLSEGLRWCDTFVKLQQPSVTSDGQAAGYWNTGYNQVYIADTGTAVVTLALCHELQPDASKRAVYTTALRKFARFVQRGCRTAPAVGSAAQSGECPSAVPQGVAQHGGWIRADGALGDGWYKGTLNLDPYTISTATTGSCGLVELADVLRADEGEGSPEAAALDAIARRAAAWIVGNRTADGRIPYTISPPTPGDHAVYQPISYSAESFIDVDLRYADARPRFLAPLRSTCAFLVRNQSADGSWGAFDGQTAAAAAAGPPLEQARFTASGDAQRSPRALSLLQWCDARLGGDASFGAAAQKYVNFLLNPASARAFGVNALALPTGFVGLAIADLISPWITFRKHSAPGAQ